MSSISVSGDLKYLLFVFLGIMVAILVLGYHKSPVASKNLGVVQRMATIPNAPNSASVFSSGVTPVSTESYAEKEY
jgi:uncharacterized membrane protein